MKSSPIALALLTAAAAQAWAQETWESGFPINPTDGVNRANTNIGVDRPNAAGVSQSFSNPTTAEWFDTAAFTLQPLYTFGNAGRNTVIGPHGFYWDFSTHKGSNAALESSGLVVTPTARRSSPRSSSPASAESCHHFVRVWSMTQSK
jgi:hypothetical protein